MNDDDGADDNENDDEYNENDDVYHLNFYLFICHA